MARTGRRISAQALETAKLEITRLRQELRVQQARNAGQIQAIRHGISNHLQILASTAATWHQRSTTPELTHFAEEIHGQVQAIAKVYRTLALGHGEIALAVLLDELCTDLAAMFANPNIAIELDGDHASVSADMAFTLALITSELVSNACRHAFADRAHGTVQVHVRSDGGHIILSVADDGRGLPPMVRARARERPALRALRCSRNRSGDGWRLSRGQERWSRSPCHISLKTQRRRSRQLRTAV